MLVFTILAAMGLLSALFVISLVVGESIAMKNKNSRFTKWWRKNMIGIVD